MLSVSTRSGEVDRHMPYENGDYLEWECGACGADNEMDANDKPLPCRDCGFLPDDDVEVLS